MKTTIQSIAAAFVGLILFTSSTEAVQLASDFVITNRTTGKPIRRDDYKGKILFLDFFAYWCGPCRESSPTVEAEIAKYYEARGGNPYGLKVEVVGVNIESENPTLTDDFIASVGFKTVADDFGMAGGAWAQFGNGYIPHFVIINGVSGASRQQWEVLHSDSGFRGSAFYRGLIDSIKPTGPDIAVEQPSGTSLVDGKAKKSFGTVLKGSSKIAVKTFTVKNKGSSSLTGLAVSKSGGNSGDFVVTPIGKSILGPGETTTFIVKFVPKATGSRLTTLKISSNDADENPFDIVLVGTGVVK